MIIRFKFKHNCFKKRSGLVAETSDVLLFYVLHQPVINLFVHILYAIWTYGALSLSWQLVFLSDSVSVPTCTIFSKQSDDKSFRRSPSWRKRFRPRDGQGLGMMPGSIETLPAGFRLSTMSIPSSMAVNPKKQLQPEGKKGSWGKQVQLSHWLTAFISQC